MLLTDLVAKELEILSEALPQAKRIGVLWNPTTPSHTPAVRAVEDAAKKLGIRLVLVPGRVARDFDAAFGTMVQEGAAGFLVVPSPLSTSYRTELVELALKNRLPAMYGTRITWRRVGS
jgi:putative tryptophan/tyrosine transport system substrate-binding protein